MLNLKAYGLGLILIVCSFQKRIEITYASSHEHNSFMYDFFNGVMDGFFVDIGAPVRPFPNSTTMILRTLGWNGISIVSHPQAIENYIGLENEDLVLPMEPFKKGKQQGSVLTLKDICLKYYSRIPDLVRIGEEYVSDKYLQTNNWQYEKCTPQTILLQSNNGNAEKFLNAKGYKVFLRTNFYQLFILGSKVKHYSLIKQGNQQSRKEQEIQFSSFSGRFEALGELLGRENTDVGSYQPSTSPFYLHFAIQGNNLDLNKIIRHSNRIAKNQSLSNRPIVVYHFDPSKGAIICFTDYQLEDLSVSNGDKYIGIKLKKKETSLSIYIYDHGFLNEGELKIINTFSKV